MYLSRLILNPRSVSVRQDIATPYEMHRTIMRAFAGSKPAGDGRVLWRLDRDRRNGAPVLYVQSPSKPTWEALSTEYPDYLLPPAGEPNPAVRDDFPPAFRVGQTLSFRLRANPTVKKKVTGKKNGRRLGIIGEELQIKWLRRKGERGGFSLLSAVAVCEDQPKALKKGKKHGAPLSLLSVRFEGVLAVTDPERFTQTLAAGIGSGKAFGFGLLSIAPA